MAAIQLLDVVCRKTPTKENKPEACDVYENIGKMAATMRNVDEIRDRVILCEFDVKNVSGVRLSIKNK